LLHSEGTATSSSSSFSSLAAAAAAAAAPDSRLAMSHAIKHFI